MSVSTRARSLVAGLGAIVILVLGAVVEMPADALIIADTPGRIDSYKVQPALSCSVTSGDQERFNMCGTVLTVDGTIFQAATVLGGVWETLTPVKQTRSGYGSESSPFTVVTVVTAGTTGVQLTETDTWWPGATMVRTTYTVNNTTGAFHDVTVGRGGDCNTTSDQGFGAFFGNAGVRGQEIACQTTTGNGGQNYPTAQLSFRDLTGRASYIEGEYVDTFLSLSTADDLPSTCLCYRSHDNAIALRWRLGVVAGKRAVIKMATIYDGAIPPPPPAYVALGDSYSSGEGAPGASPKWLANTDTATNKCHRSAQGWAPLVAGRTLTDLAFSFHACSGALISDLYRANHDPDQNPAEIMPQLSWLDGSTRIVTISIGGNNAGFGDVMRYCAKKTFFANTCEENFEDPVDAAIETMGDTSSPEGLRHAYEAIHSAAPYAQVYVLGYPRFFPTKPPQSCSTGLSRFTFIHEDMRWINTENAKLNDLISFTAGSVPNTHYVDVSDALTEHDLCAASSDKWINGARLRSGEYSYHPNASGQKAIADIVEAAIE